MHTIQPILWINKITEISNNKLSSRKEDSKLIKSMSNIVIESRNRYKTNFNALVQRQEEEISQ